MTLSVSVSPIWNGTQFLDNNGVVLNGGMIYQYEAGSFTVEQTTYSDNMGTTPNANPIVLDSSGRIPVEIYLQNGFAYNLVLTNSGGTVLGYVDNVIGVVSSSSTSASTAVWQLVSGTPSYVSPTSFQLPGDFSVDFAVGNRVQIENSDSSFNYGTVISVTYSSPNTVVSIVNDTGTLNSSMTSAYWSVATAIGPIVDAGAVTYNAPATYVSTNTVGYQIKTIGTALSTLSSRIQDTYVVLPATGTPNYVISADPTITSYTVGQKFTVSFAGGSTGAATLNVNGLGAINLLSYNSSATLVNPTIAAGQISDVAYDGTEFIFLDTLPPINNGIPLTDFTGINQSLSATGYQILPGGLIMQWGTFTCPGGGSYINVPFALAFPTACFSAVATSGDASKVLAVNSFTNSYVRVQNGGGLGNFWAVGH